MGEDGTVNEVSETDSNINSLPEKTLDDMSEKKNLEADGGKVLEDNGIDDLKKDDVKEMEVYKKADGVEEVEEDKKANGVEEVEEDKKDDGITEEEDKKDEGVKEEEAKRDDGVKEEEEDNKENGVKEIEDKKDANGSEAEKMAEETEVKEIKEREEVEKPEVDVMEEEATPNDKEETNEKEKTEEEEEEKENKDKINKPKETKMEDSKVKKGSKRHVREKIDGEKGKEKRKKMMEVEPRTPAIDRPVRERKSVERLVTSIEKDASKEFQIEKGRGTPLKDIPNVAFKLSRRKADDTFRLLHTILFGRRGKAVQIKSNILRFSGFVWHENEEKQQMKVKEKFDKCNKEKLLEFCDVLDIPIAKATTRKEDIVTKLIDFLVAPHAMTTVLLAEKESTRGKKRTRGERKGSSASWITTSKRSAKSRKKKEDSSVVEERKSTTDTEDESEGEEEEEREEKEDEENEEENENGVPEKSEDEMMKESESEDKNDSGNESEDLEKQKKTTKPSSTKKKSAAKTKTKKITVTHKSRSTPRRTPKKSPSTTQSKGTDDSDGSPKVFSRKKKSEQVGKQKSSILIKSASKEKTVEKVFKGKGKNKEKLNPSDEQLRDATCEILKEVDFNTATFTDILKQLAKRFNMDLTPRKASIKLMIQEELTKLADEADDEDGEDDAEKDETRSAGQEVKA